MVEIQKRKKMLAQVTFTDGPMLESEINMGILQVWARVKLSLGLDSNITLALKACPWLRDLSYIEGSEESIYPNTTTVIVKYADI